MRTRIEKSPSVGRQKPPRRREKPKPAANERLAEQDRKLLAKHYANKYRVR
jgi:hypothetical protein